MTIFVLDYSARELLRIHVSSRVENLIETKYEGDVESYLSDNEKFFGIRMNDCHYMAIYGDTSIRDFDAP